jgi:hypothetical protein
MQHRWLNKEKLSDACANIAGMWDKANGDLADFLKQVEESGASIESASVSYANGPKKGESVSEFKSSEKDATNLAEFVKKVEESRSSIRSATVYGPTTKDIIDVITTTSVLDHPDLSYEENRKLQDEYDWKTHVEESGSSIGSATVYGPTAKDITIDVTSKKVDESANVEAGASSKESNDDSFLSDADGNGSIAEAIGKS